MNQHLRLLDAAALPSRGRVHANCAEKTGECQSGEEVIVRPIIEMSGLLF